MNLRQSWFRFSKILARIFFDLRKQAKHTFVIVTHNEELAGLADRKLVMKDGLLIDQLIKNTNNEPRFFS